MKKYRAYITSIRHGWVSVEADDEEDASVLIEDLIFYDNVYWFDEGVGAGIDYEIEEEESDEEDEDEYDDEEV